MFDRVNVQVFLTAVNTATTRATAIFESAEQAARSSGHWRLDDFPDDARITVRDDDDANCLIVLIKSATVLKEIGYHATAAFGTSDSPDLFRRNDVSDATVSLAFESEPDLGFC